MIVEENSIENAVLTSIGDQIETERNYKMNSTELSRQIIASQDTLVKSGGENESQIQATSGA